MTLIGVSVAAIVMMLTVATADLVVLLDAHVRATVAADAAALAAAPVTFDPTPSADHPCAVASAYASANGATLATCDARPDLTWNARTVEVSVVVTAELFLVGSTGVTGRSAAEFRPVDLGR
ncbi:MAG: hypothetical protein HKN07_10320 [Acidimicrobiia bacterium]|nr:hypothetical protein [Acidimicrobiia bacterium]NNF64641.1 hypothetical protein [Acidimicrobiia bacterium]